MEYDAFTGGVAPGGLRSKSDIRILICYMLKSVNAPLSGDDIIKVLQEKSLANYFEASDALSALVSLGNVTREEDNTYVLTKRGKSVADDLEQLIPSSVLALRTTMGSESPADIIIPTILATLVSTIVGVLLVKIFIKKG